jgi:hemoglobin-like flavoprotein
MISLLVPCELAMEHDIHTLRASLWRLLPRADRLAARFYERLFSEHPEMVALFDGTSIDDQKRKLVRALSLLVSNLERPEFLRPYLQGLGAIHRAYGVGPEAYPGFAACLLDALREAAGPSWAPREEAAWRAAMELISTTMIDGAEKVGGES